MKPLQLIQFVEKLVPEVAVTFSPADPGYPRSIPVVCFSTCSASYCIDCSAGRYSIYDSVGESELYLSFKDPSHVLPLILFELGVDGRHQAYSEFCEQQTEMYSDLVYEFSYEHEMLEIGSGYELYSGSDFIAYFNPYSIPFPSTVLPGVVLIRPVTGEIFEAVGGSSSGSDRWKLVAQINNPSVAVECL